MALSLGTGLYDYEVEGWLTMNVWHDRESGDTHHLQRHRERRWDIAERRLVVRPAETLQREVAASRVPLNKNMNKKK